MRTLPGSPLDRAMTPDEEQSRLLQDISAQIKKHAFYLEKAMVRCSRRPWCLVKCCIECSDAPPARKPSSHECATSASAPNNIKRAV